MGPIVLLATPYYTKESFTKLEVKPGFGGTVELVPKPHSLEGLIFIHGN